MKTLYIAILALMCCLGAASISAEDIAPTMFVENASARAVAPGVPVSAAYMVIENGGSADHALTAAHSVVAENVEIHSHASVDGMMQMRRIESVALPVSTPVVFEPGGLHIMLIGLLQPLKAGDVIEIELEFDDGSRKAVDFAVN